MDGNRDYSVLVLSCDKYQALWPSFFKRFSEHWIDNPTTFLVTNFLTPTIDGVTVLPIGEDIDWSSNLLRALNEVKSDYVIVLLEDVFFNQNLEFDTIRNLLSSARMLGAGYINIKAQPKPKGRSVGSGLVSLEKGMHYRVALSPALWRVDVLQEILVVGESPWEFERLGSERSNRFDNFFATEKSLLSFDHVIIGGRVARNVAELKDIKDTQIVRDFPLSSRLSWYLHIAATIRNWFFTRVVPSSIQQRVRRAFH